MFGTVILCGLWFSLIFRRHKISEVKTLWCVEYIKQTKLDGRFKKSCFDYQLQLGRKIRKFGAEHVAPQGGITPF